MIDVRTGIVTSAASATTPTVRLEGDDVGYPTRNCRDGWTPVVNQRVLVLIRMNKRVGVIAPA